MTSWQRRARAGVAVIGIASAALVYAAYRDRRPAPVAVAVERLDPTAIIESTAGELQQLQGVEQDFVVTFDDQLAYQNGRSRWSGVKVAVKNRGGRDFVVSASEAEAGEREVELQLTGAVTLVASDGFELSTDRATFNQNSGIVRATGAVIFRKGGMSGSGIGMTYDKNSDVLGISSDAHVLVVDASGSATMDFSAATASLDRLQDVLQLDGGVHVLRGEQAIDADHAIARMSAGEEFIQFLELRGNARVEGGAGSVSSMAANDIDLDYSDDGQVLERVALTGGGAIGTRGDDGSPGRRFEGGALHLELAPDGAVTHANGTGQVRVALPAAGEQQPRSITANRFEGRGAAETGLRDLQFMENVEYREDVAAGSPSRVARSQGLRMALEGDAVASATFSGGTTFEEQALTAAAGEAEYRPAEGTLRLMGRDAKGSPRVADERIAIEAPSISVTLESREMNAGGGVKTTLRPDGEKVGGGAGRKAPENSRLPGLFKQDQPANVTSDRLEYGGGKGRAVFAGSAWLWQGETAVRANTITIDQTSGDLAAIGSAMSTIALDGDRSDGRADDIHYTDAKRVIVYDSAVSAAAARGRGAPAAGRRGTVPAEPPRGNPPAPAVTPAPGRGAGRGPAGAVVAAPTLGSRLSRDREDLRAERIEVFLAEDAGRVDRVEAYTGVTATLPQRSVSGARLTYHAADERYEMSGTGAAPVKVVERSGGCREITGKTLTFFKSTDRIIVDGQEELRTRTSSGPCPQTR